MPLAPPPAAPPVPPASAPGPEFDPLGRGGEEGPFDEFQGPRALMVTGTAGDDRLMGTLLRDVFQGGPGDDLIAPVKATLMGLPGAYGPDLAYGGEGDDTIFFSFTTYEAIYGGPGDDALAVRRGGGHTYREDHFFGGEGRDLIDYRFHTTLPEKWGFLRDAVVVRLEEGIARRAIAHEDWTEEQLNPWEITFESVEDARGSAADDELYGSSEGNRLDGWWGDDAIWGGEGDDRLIGRSGDDHLYDGPGSDNLFGGPGGDVFVLTADGVVDSIKDFEDGLDLIDISAWTGAEFEDFSFRLHRSGKIHVDWQDEVLAIQGTTLRDLGAEDFLFG